MKTKQTNRTNSILKRFFLLLIVCAFIQGCFSNNSISGNNNNKNINPYKVLGVEKSSNQEDIRKRYRKLCLKYHPDKNVHLDDKERIKCENTFKAIQEANTLIGTAEAKRNYDSQSIFEQRHNSFQRSSTYNPQHPFHPNFHGDPFNHRRHQNFYQRSNRRRIYVNGIDISHLFHNNYFPNNCNKGGFFSNQFGDDDSSSSLNRQYGDNGNDGQKSIYVQKVTVSLEELYSGVRNKEFQFNDGFFRPYRAAFKGGIAAQIALQGLLTSAPLLLRTSWPVTLMAFLLTCHVSLPRPSKLFYFSRIKRGWKSGTKLTFQQPGIDVVFILDEEKHDRFVRVGDDLKTTVTIGQTKAKKGCTIMIDPLGRNELPIMVKLKRGEIKHDRHIVEVKGRGWPRNDGSSGNLYITVRVVSDAKAKKMKKSKHGVA